MNSRSVGEVVLGVGVLEVVGVGLRALLSPLEGLVDEGATSLDTESVGAAAVVVLVELVLDLFLEPVDLGVILGRSTSSTVFSKVTAGWLTATLARLFDFDFDFDEDEPLPAA